MVMVVVYLNSGNGLYPEQTFGFEQLTTQTAKYFMCLSVRLKLQHSENAEKVQIQLICFDLKN